MIKLYRSHGLNPEWVLDGQEPMYLREGMTPPSAMEEPGAYTPEKPRSRTVVVSAMSGSALAGEPWREKPLEMITIPEPFNRPQLITVRMDGSGMEPLIRRGAYIGLDRSQRRIISGEIYGVDLPLEGLAIKRIFHDAENARLILRSENPLQQDQFMPVEGSSDRIVGRVIWVLQEI